MLMSYFRIVCFFVVPITVASGIFHRISLCPTKEGVILVKLQRSTFLSSQKPVTVMEQSVPERHNQPSPDLALLRGKQKASQGAFSGKRRSSLWKQNSALLTMMIPGLLLLFVFAYLPMAGLVIAFK